MKKLVFLLLAASLLPIAAHAQPAFSGPPPSRAVVQDADRRREEYFSRIDEALAWKAASVKLDTPEAIMKMKDMSAIAAKLVRREDVAGCSAAVIEIMKTPSTGPFWMFPVACVAYTGRDLLSPEAKAAIRQAWRSTMQLRGDTENHWAMYYASLYLMSELYPNEPGDTWYTGKSSEENLAESRDYLIHWMDLMTTVGQGEFNPTGYLTEYAIPMGLMATWAKDPAMRLRARMTLDWLFADLAANSLNGVLRGPHARTTEDPVMQRWNDHASFYNWLLFGNTPPPAGYGGFGIYFATVARNYAVPEVIYRIAVDRDRDYVQRDLKRSRRRWRYSDVEMAPIYKTSYLRRDYAVGSYQGGRADPIQTHVWDVTWAVPDPRGAHNTMFSNHPHSSPVDMQMSFTAYPEAMIPNLAREGKPSYDEPDKILGASPYEQVFQDLDTVVALYDIPAGARHPQVNGFLSKDLVDREEDKSGWIFARGGNAFLAYRPLADYTLTPFRGYHQLPSPVGYKWERVVTGDTLLQSFHRKNGTIVQAASASEFASFDAFKRAIRALPLEFKLEPTPTVRMKTLRGKQIEVTYGKAPVIDGRPLDYAKWKLFEGPYLNAEKGSRRLTITHGRLKRVLDFATLAVTDSVSP
ncbi:MAG: hypothetical protein JWM88_120 [Verrucomicrobia bacterium]|nr:hypothetical protein [Verrucomicrobiota bacterium]